MNYCSRCSGVLKLEVPPGDDRERSVCSACGVIHYQNPRVVVGSILRWKDRILLCRRSIEPRYGTWTVPAGYLENGESVEDGARREMMEEARATAHTLEPYGLYNIRHVNQIYLIFTADLASEDFGAGEESLEVHLFAEPEIPWEELSFPVVEMSLKRYFQDIRRGIFPFHMDDVTIRMKRPD